MLTLSEKKMEEVIGYLQTETNLVGAAGGDGASTTCSVCGSHDPFFVSPDLVLTPNISEGGEPSTEKAQPFVQVTCEQCGNTHFMNALVVDPLEELGM